ncbi:hypothetical protein L1787_01650 [Acuticoccus sp. M5D2P5]|uniref:hypothetical protein n=1 Tax=Acuticoccus kalidii TaxID=2910977 RepID=UPI001F3314B4|nr:hypothetical protein [Acuticoccus kalidii]MCF3932117.1 hypothetical protein [Acuticoccus kalidii]
MGETMQSETVLGRESGGRVDPRAHPNAVKFFRGVLARVTQRTVRTNVETFEGRCRAWWTEELAYGEPIISYDGVIFPYVSRRSEHRVRCRDSEGDQAAEPLPVLEGQVTCNYRIDDEGRVVIWYLADTLQHFSEVHGARQLVDLLRRGISIR